MKLIDIEHLKKKLQEEDDTWEDTAPCLDGLIMESLFNLTIMASLQDGTFL